MATVGNAQIYGRWGVAGSARGKGMHMHRNHVRKHRFLAKPMAVLIAVVMTALSLGFMASPAQATDSNDEDFWESAPGEICTKINTAASAGGYTMPAEPAGYNWSKLIMKKGSGNIGVENQVFNNPVAGQVYTWVGFQPQQSGGWSHLILCKVPEPVVTEPRDASASKTLVPADCDSAATLSWTGANVTFNRNDGPLTGPLTNVVVTATPTAGHDWSTDPNNDAARTVFSGDLAGPTGYQSTDPAGDCYEPPVDVCTPVDWNGDDVDGCGRPLTERETRDTQGNPDCETGTVTTTYEERTRTQVFENGQIKWGEWSDWTEYQEPTVVDATEEQCPDEEEEDPAGDITFCHWVPGQGETKEGYNVITTNENAFYMAGHIDHVNDVFPAGSFTKNGETISWNAQGDQSLLINKDCVKPPTSVLPPTQPPSADPCGPGNVDWTWTKSDTANDTASVDWTYNDDANSWTAVPVTGYVFSDGQPGADPQTMTFTLPAETNTAACTSTVSIPAQPGVTDPCGTGNATWNVPTSANGLVWTLNLAGELIVTITTPNTSFSNSNSGPTSHNFGLPTETNFEVCDVADEEIEIPATPDVADPCDPDNAEWIVPGDEAPLQWDLNDLGELIVTITADDTVFEGTGLTTYNFGLPEELNDEPCEVGGQELEIPAEPGIKDPCGRGNAEWIVPDDSETLDWTLTDGVLTVEILVADTVFSGTQDTTYSFGEAKETNKAPCEVKGEEGDGDDNQPPMTVEVKGEQGVAPGVPTAVDAGLGSDELPLGSRRNPLWLLAVGGGLGLMGSAGLRRRATANR